MVAQRTTILKISSPASERTILGEISGRLKDYHLYKHGRPSLNMVVSDDGTTSNLYPCAHVRHIPRPSTLLTADSIKYHCS